MSKAEGKKIAIQFTDELNNDFSFDNSSAFTITGVEPRYVEYPSKELGPLLDKTYLVESVDVYPVEGINIGGPIELGKTYTPGQAALWDGTYTSRYLGGCTILDNAGTRMTNAIPVTAGESYIFSGGNRCRLRWNDTGGNCIGSSDEGNTADPITKVAPTGAVSVYYYYASADFSIPPSVIGTTLVEEFLTEETTNFDVLEASGNYKIVWIQDTPIGTDITVEYATGATQGVFTEISNGSIVAVDTNLWLRAILETTDTSKTPTLTQIVIEDASIPQNKILLTMQNLNQFKNAEGSLIVAYDATKGNLAGISGVVASFSEVLYPEELIRVPNPLIAENVSASIVDFQVNQTRVYYKNGYEAENISASVIDFAVVLTYTGGIDP